MLYMGRWRKDGVKRVSARPIQVPTDYGKDCRNRQPISRYLEVESFDWKIEAPIKNIIEVVLVKSVANAKDSLTHLIWYCSSPARHGTNDRYVFEDA